LQLNFSDSKYKSVLRLVDVAIPNFDNGDTSASNSTAIIPSGYQLSSGIFDLPETEYNVDDEDYKGAEDDHSVDERSREVRVFPDRTMCCCSYISNQGLALRQRTFELSFQVTTLRASLYKSQGLAGEKPLGHVAFDNVSLLLLYSQYDLKIEVCLRSVPLIPLENFHLYELVALFSWKSQSQALNLSNFSLPLTDLRRTDRLLEERTFFAWTTLASRAILLSIDQNMKATIRSSL
jgi:hypothetical protein